MDGARIFINDQYRGQTGKDGFVVSDLEPGSYEVSLYKSGYPGRSKTVEIGESTRETVEIDLERETGDDSAPVHIPTIESTSRPYPVKTGGSGDIVFTPKANPSPVTPGARQSPLPGHLPPHLPRPRPAPLDQVINP